MPDAPGSPSAPPARKIVPIVEGYGEVDAVPALLYRILHGADVYDFLIGTPRNAHGKDNLLKAEGVERFLRLALLDPGCAAVLIVLDADDDCPLTLARVLAARVRALRPERPVAVVVANRMYECWLVASRETVFPGGVLPPLPTDLDPEAVSAKAHLDDCLRDLHGSGRAYKETSDQADMTRRLDPVLASLRSRSFRRLESAIAQLRRAVEEGDNALVTPDTPVPSHSPADAVRSRRKRRYRR